MVGLGKEINMEKDKVTRSAVLEQAIHDCFKEMYAKSQPSADWDEIIEDFRNGKYDRETRIYERHYLSQDEYTYIVNKYMDAYRVKCEWREDADVMIEYLKNGGTKDKYIEGETDENGFKYPGHRGYETVPPIKDQIRKIMADFDCSEAAKNVADDIADKVIETMETCKDFYRFNSEENNFRFTCALGASPTSNPKTVVEYWKSQGKDVVIEERNPELFWYYDNGYTDEDIEFDFEKSMDEINREWKERVRKREEESEKRRKELEELIKRQEDEGGSEKGGQ